MVMRVVVVAVGWCRGEQPAQVVWRLQQQEGWGL